MSNSISLGKMSLGKMSLGRIGGEMVVSSGGGGPLYKRILASMPDELRKSLVCWYSPNLQGLTNAELYNSDNLDEGGLHDLSGNGHDMDLRGFDGIEGGGHVDEDGNLVFDGVNDWGKLAINTKYNDFGAFFFADIGNSGYSLSMSSATKQGNRNILVQKNYARDQIRYINDIEVKVNYGATQAVYLDSYRVNDTEIDTTPLEWSDCLYLSRLRENNNTYTIMTFKSLILFNRGLSADEEQWCRDNMLVSQEPSKRTVTLWLVDEGSGTFDKFKTLQVQDGNMIGKYDEEGDLVLPVYDVDATHQTSLQWYTDAECTEEYSGEYITEDTFMYAKEEPKLQ